ncbi:MAG: DNA polymerase ligase N-terminal domain-containing protein, partial [Anaerolineae bacterium]
MSVAIPGRAPSLGPGQPGPPLYFRQAFDREGTSRYGKLHLGSDSTSINAYRAKRDFGATPEPAPGSPPRPGAETRFVVQRHEARRLHYDLRLEVGGVLASFAVPKGFSWDPAAKHLAVRTEDHPLEYLTFEGTIPKGQYGAGTMTVWDVGTYSLAKGGAPEAALAAGKLEVAFRGRRLRGEWHMVKTRGEDQWLLFKYRDRYARGPDEALFPLDLTRASPSPFPRRPGAMEATPAAEAFYDPEWVFELRLSGRRLFLGHDAAAVRALLPGGPALGIEVPGLVSDLGRVRAERFLMDGVLVAHDPNGRPNAELLAGLLAAGETGGLVYYAFDLLHYEDWSLRDFTLHERKRALASLLPRSSLRQLLYVDHVAGRGDELFRSVRA